MNGVRAGEAPPRIQIHASRANNLCAEPGLVAKVKEQDNRHGEHLEEEVLGNGRGRGIGGGAVRDDGRHGGPELRDNDEDVGRQRNVRANDARLGAKRQLVEAVAGNGPGAAEADVAETDAAPGEEAGEAADGNEPVKDFALVLEVDEISEQAYGEGEEDGCEGAALAVDVGEDLGRVRLLCQRSESARCAKDGGVADADDGNEDDGVHDAG